MGELHGLNAWHLLGLGRLDEALQAAEHELARGDGQGNTREAWVCRFVRCEVLRIRGFTEEALAYLNSLGHPDQSDNASNISLMMYRGYYTGLLGRHAESHTLLSEALAAAARASLPELQARVYLLRAFIFFRQEDYPSSERLYRAVLDLSVKLGDWYFEANALWGIGKNLVITRRYRRGFPLV